MSVSTNGQINFGIILDEDFEFPWSESEGIEDWWREVNGEDHPLPVELVNYCSDDSPMWLLALPDVGLTCHRGYPEEFDPLVLVVTTEQEKALFDFCHKYGIETNRGARWYLTSYWG